MSTFEVRYLNSAQQDLFDLLEFLAAKESPQRASEVLEKIRLLCEGLESFPHRGHIPPELAELGSNKFLELHFKPYRIIYQVSNHTVFIHVICDGRRDMQSLLKKRLLTKHQ